MCTTSCEPQPYNVNSYYMSAADKIAFAATIIAGCAFFTAIWQAYLARHHNRLSVRPAFEWNRDRFVTDTGTEVVFSVRNQGIGPAIIRERYFLVNGERFEATSGSGDEVRELVAAVFAQGFQYHLRQHGLPGIGAAVPQGGECVIARLHFPNANDSMVEAILAQGDSVRFCIHYESFYGERYVLRTD
jgi:hypothetical protein